MVDEARVDLARDDATAHERVTAQWVADERERADALSEEDGGEPTDRSRRSDDGRVHVRERQPEAPGHIRDALHGHHRREAIAAGDGDPLTDEVLSALAHDRGEPTEADD